MKRLYGEFRQGQERKKKQEDQPDTLIPIFCLCYCVVSYASSLRVVFVVPRARICILGGWSLPPLIRGKSRRPSCHRLPSLSTCHPSHPHALRILKRGEDREQGKGYSSSSQQHHRQSQGRRSRSPLRFAFTTRLTTSPLTKHSPTYMHSTQGKTQDAAWGFS